ncbi:hypothetical protein [Halococcus saccharolyticus]|uniref:DUF8151 domain-containing protein n=1 Tax=Halococcus saccharolyticus DSM 5350 TaxID=1227455 RepID=M0MKS5_9EURY|nr:hypothetical protein [Halococcus saccharolyticus]EMA45015.1 hypothetical protein C449_10169 [Halococcus saccharolyticus DSM 5350]
MKETLLQLGTEFGAAAVRAIGAVCAAALGVVVELNGLQTLDTGVGIVGVWMTALGCLLLVIGYVLASDAIDLLRAKRQPTN